MKTSNLFSAVAGFALAFLFIVDRPCFAQGTGGPGNTFGSVVTIQATDKFAAWTGDTGTFTVFRSGSVTQALNVYLCISGTASNGVDYQSISQFVQIPSGARSNTIVVQPINLGQTNIRTVNVQVCPSPVAGPMSSYYIGLPNVATVYIGPGGFTNLPPIVRITSPPNGSTFYGPLNLPLFAYAHDLEGPVTSVEFFDGNSSLGQGRRVTNSIVFPAGANVSELWTLIWSNAPVGQHVLTALATDNGGASSRSEPVKVNILSPPPPPTNRPVIITIVATDPVAIEGTNCWPWVGLTNVNPNWNVWTTGPGAFRIFTNCGPKNATFTVRRHGDTNDPVTIPYVIGGTASNGADYVTLSGFVTIPAGDRVALINVAPIDDNVPEPPETVLLKLVPDSSSPLKYALGYPRAAGAIIVDSSRPRPTTALLADSCFHLAANGPDGAWFRIEFSTDMRNWTSICTNQVVNGSIDFVDPDASGDTQRFYRATPEPNPPAE